MFKGTLKKLKEIMSAPPMPVPPEGVEPKREGNLVIGTQYKCRKFKSLDRRDVIRGMRVGSAVYIEPSEYNGSPSYLVIDAKTGADCGAISPGTSEWLASHYPADTVMIGEVSGFVDGAPKIVYEIYG